jgi:hypothetical protein
MMGFDAINAVGADWEGRSSFWQALRALGTLQGIWEGGRRDTLPLRKLLDPRLIRQHAIPAYPFGAHRERASGILANYEREVLRAFEPVELDVALAKLEQVRHLVHGMGAQGNVGRDARLQSLRSLAAVGANLQLLINVSTFWWTAALLDPDHNLRAGSAPWEL